MTGRVRSFLCTPSLASLRLLAVTIAPTDLDTTRTSEHALETCDRIASDDRQACVLLKIGRRDARSRSAWPAVATNLVRSQLSRVVLESAQALRADLETATGTVAQAADALRRHHQTPEGPTEGPRPTFGISECADLIADALGRTLVCPFLNLFEDARCVTPVADALQAVTCSINARGTIHLQHCAHYLQQ